MDLMPHFSLIKINDELNDNTYIGSGLKLISEKNIIHTVTL